MLNPKCTIVNPRRPCWNWRRSEQFFCFYMVQSVLPPGKISPNNFVFKNQIGRNVVTNKSSKYQQLINKSIFFLRSIISSWNNSDRDQEIDKRNQRYETFIKYFGDSISCSATVSTRQSASSEVQGKPTSAMVSRSAAVRNLRNISGYVAPKKSTFQIKSESGIKMEVDDFNRPDFNLYADMEMPTDIFEPERGLQSKTAAGRPLPVLPDTATPLSPSVQAVFEVNRNFSVNRNAKMSFALRGAWPSNRLKRKYIGAPRLGVGFRGYGVIGRRWCNTPLTESRFFNSDCLNYVL